MKKRQFDSPTNTCQEHHVQLLQGPDDQSSVGHEPEGRAPVGQRSERTSQARHDTKQPGGERRAAKTRLKPVIVQQTHGEIRPGKKTWVGPHEKGRETARVTGSRPWTASANRLRLSAREVNTGPSAAGPVNWLQANVDIEQWAWLYIYIYIFKQKGCSSRLP